MADISGLSGLMETAPLDLPQYKAAQEFRLPKAGVYTVVAPESFPSTAFGKSQSGYLTAEVNPTIVGPTNEGFQIRYTRVSAKTWTDRKGNEVSQLGRYLKSTGLNEKIGGTPQEQADAVESTAGRTYKIKGDWVARNRNTGYTVEGMENFPVDEKGEHQPWIDDPTDTNADGEPVRLKAFFQVVAFLAPRG